MSKAAGLVRGSGLYAIGNLVPKALALVMIPIYTYLLTKREYGIVTYVTSLAAIMLAITELGFRSSVLRFYFDYEEDRAKLGRFLGSSTIFLLGFGLLVLIAGFATSSYWAPLLVKDESMTFWPFLGLGLLIAFSQLGHIVPTAMIRAREKAGLYAGLQIGEYILIATLIVIALVGFERSARAALWGRFLAVGIFFFVMNYIVWREAKPSLDLGMLGQSLVYGLPLTAHAIANWSQTFLDRVLLERLTTLDQVGLYSLGYNIGMLMSAVNLAFNRAFLPYHFREAENNPDAKRHLARIAEEYWVLLSVIAVFGTLFAREGIMLLTPERFYGAYRVVPWVIAGYLIHGMYYPVINNLLMLKKTKAIPLATATAAGVNVLLNLWWIPKWDIIGAAAATTCSYLIMTAIVYLASQRISRMPYRLGRVAFVMGLYGVVALGVHLVELDSSQVWLPLLVKAIVFLAFVLLLVLLGLVDIGRIVRLIKEVIGGSEQVR